MLSELVASYLFLGGAGAGSTLLLVFLDFLSPGAGRSHKDSQNSWYVPQDSYRKLFAPGFIIALLAVGIGVVCLLADLGRVDRVSLLFTSPTFSYIALGVFTLTVLLLLVGFLAAIWYFNFSGIKRWVVRVVEGACLVAAVVTILYTGLFLQSISAIALWSSPFIPVLFALSSLSSGLALVMLVVGISGAAKQYRKTMLRLMRADSVVIFVEIIVLGVFVITGFQNPLISSTWSELLWGEAAQLFWIGVVSCGMIAPGLLGLPLGVNRLGGRMIASAVLVLIGGFCLRWCVIVVGVGPDVAQSAMMGLGV